MLKVYTITCHTNKPIQCTLLAYNVRRCRSARLAPNVRFRGMADLKRLRGLWVGTWDPLGLYDLGAEVHIAGIIQVADA
jgi:hypothetical protein